MPVQTKPAKKKTKKLSLRADQPLTEQDVEGLGVRRTAPAFKRIVGKTIEEAREELNKYRSLPDRYVPAETKRKIAQALGETVAEPEKPAAKAEEAKAPEAPKEKTQKEALLEQRAELIKQLDGILKKILAKYNLTGVTLNLEEGMAEEGSYSGQIIKLALNLENPVRVLRHESIHALKDMGFFSDAQWETLVKKAQDEWVNKYLKKKAHNNKSRYDAYVELLTKQGLNPTEVQEAIIEEAIADAFGDFDVNGAPSGLISAIHRRMKNLFKAIKEAFGQAGIDTAEEIFGKIEKGSLKPAIPMGKEQAPKMSLRGVPLSTRSIMESNPIFAMNELGLKTEGVKKPGGIFLFNDVRSIANALNNDTLNNYGTIDREDRSANARNLIAKAIADEVAYQVGTTSQTGTGLGWYSNNYPKAVRKLAKKYPELGTNEHARSVFSALVAITSNGEKVSLNIKNAIGLYDKLRSGEPLVAPGSRRATALDNNLQMVQDLIERHGTNFKNVLLQEILVKDMNAALRAKGEKPSGDYLANTKVPAAAVYFGPKLGAFYANLEGAEGYLTMDMWWTRSINRMRGLLMPQATESSINKFREEAGDPNMTRDEVIASTIPLRNRYEELAWTTDLEYVVGEKEPTTKEDKPKWTARAKRKAGPAYDQLKLEHDVMKMANTIYKNEYEMLEEAPFGPNDREFMYRAVREAQKLLKQDGIDLTLADIQAALWYYEKRLYQHLSGRKADDIGYDEAISAVAGESDRPARPSVVFDQQPDRGADSERGVEDIDGVRREPPEAGQVEKKSLRGVVAEVAPNPDIPVAASWRQMTQAERLDATRSVAKKVIDPILSDMGLKGYSFKFSSGKYEGEVNPNILIEAPESATVGELEEVARVVGYILDQKAMVAYDEYNTDSGDQAGFVKVMIPTGMDDKTVTLLRNHISKEVPQADGDTLRDGSLVYGNFSAYNDNVDTLSDEEYHDAIVRAIEDFDYSENIKVSDPLKFHSQLVWPDNRESYLEGTRYGESGKIRGGEGSDVWRQGRSRLEAISEQAIALRDRWIDARGAARIGGRAGDSAAISTEPTAEYGKSIDGSEAAVGVHFSQQPRATLDSQFYGAGLRGMERERLEGQPDIRNRIYFYVDTGKGVFPEAGVGGSPHVIRLNNLYNVLKDELDLVKKAKGDTAAERSNAWEKAIKNAGFDGYFFPDPLQRQGYAVLIGKHRIETKLSLRSESPAFKFWFGQSKIVDEDGKPKVMYHGTARDITGFKPKQANAIFITAKPGVAESFAGASEMDMVKEMFNKASSEQRLQWLLDGAKSALADGYINKKDYEEIKSDYSQADSTFGLLPGAVSDSVTEMLLEQLPSRSNIIPVYIKAESPFDYENKDHVNQVINLMKAKKNTWAKNFSKYDAGEIESGNWERIERDYIQRAIKELGFDSFYVKEGGTKNLAVYSPTQIKSVTGNIGTYSPESADIRYSLRAPTTPEFKRWFGDSKFVNKDGSPKVLYHGTRGDFNTFRVGDGVFGRGVYVAEDPERTKQYWGGYGKFSDMYGSPSGGNVMPVYVRMENPKVIKTDVLKVRYPDGSKVPSKEAAKYITDQAIAEGHDGLVSMMGDKIWEAVVFSPEQIKSATGNIGTYDVTNPDIRYSLRSGAKAFNQEKLDELNIPDYKSREKLVELPIKDFLALSKRVNENSAYSREKLEQTRKYLQEGFPFTSIPFLSVNENDGQVTGHEGRHRAIALAEAGYESMPVILIMSDLRWSEQLDPNRFDYKEAWPTELKAEKGAQDQSFTTPFPVKREDSRKPYREEKQSLRSTLPASAINAMDRIAPPRYNPGYAERIMNAITGDTFTSIRQKFINRYERLAEYDRRVAKQIKQMGGVQQLADSKAETAALFSDLGAGVLESVMGVHDRVGGAPIFRNGVTTVSNYGGTVKGLLEIFRPISAFKDPDVFRMYQTWSAVQRGMRLNVEGREELITQADFKAINDLKRNNPSLIKTFEGVQKDWLAYNNALVKYQVDTGVITPAMAKEWTKHGDYFPFYRLMDGEDVAGPKTFSSIGNVKPPKKLKGGENALGDFFENIVRNSQAAIQAGMKNVAAQRATDQALRLNEVTRLTSKQTGVNVYRVYENGKEVYYKSHDPLFIEAIKALNMADIPFMGLLAGPANLLRNLVTKDPAFMLANMMRDSLSAWATTGIKMTPVFDTLNNFSKAIAGKSPELDKLYAAGILGGYDYALGTKDAARAFETQLRRRSGQLTAFEIGTKPVTSLWGALEKGTQASDAATRMEVYKKTLAATGNEAEALAAALEVMNFNRKGNNPMIRVLTAAVPFLNARIQGLDVLFRTAFMPLGGSSNEQAQQRMKTFWVRGMTMLALSSMYWLLTHDDEEYKKQEQETRDNNWLIPSLGIKIPIPFEVGVMFKVIPERIMALSFGTDTAKDFTDSMKRQFVGTFAFNPIPQVVLPLYEAKTNYSFFTDRPIIGKGLENVADKYQIGPSTSRTAQLIGDSLGFSPMKVDHLIKGYTGTIGTYASDLFDMVYDMGADSPKASKRFEQMPIIKRFAVDPEARGTVTAYYKLKDQVDQAVRTANLLERSNNFEEGTKYTLENLRLLATDDYVKDIEKSMKDYREMKQQIMAAPYSADTKRDLLKSIGQMESLTTANIQNIKKFAQ